MATFKISDASKNTNDWIGINFQHPHPRNQALTLDNIYTNYPTIRSFQPSVDEPRLTLSNGNLSFGVPFVLPDTEYWYSGGIWVKPKYAPSNLLLTIRGNAGGGGGAGDYHAGNYGNAGGGGGGFYESIWASELPDTVAINVGAGGAAPDYNGQTGGTTSFGSYFIAYGGQGTVRYQRGYGAGGRVVIRGVTHYGGASGASGGTTTYGGGQGLENYRIEYEYDEGRAGYSNAWTRPGNSVHGGGGGGGGSRYAPINGGTSTYAGRGANYNGNGVFPGGGGAGRDGDKDSGWGSIMGVGAAGRLIIWYTLV